VSPGLRRRLDRLERERRGGRERLRVVDWWPGQPKPAAEPGELLVLVKQYGEPPHVIPEAGG
jgi:hypothetical protein